MNPLAQLPDFGVFAQWGILGIVLGWFMLVVTPRLRGIEQAQDRTAKAVLLLTIGLAEASDTVKAKAKELLAQIEAKDISKKEP